MKGRGESGRGWGVADLLMPPLMGRAELPGRHYAGRLEVPVMGAGKWWQWMQPTQSWPQPLPTPRPCFPFLAPSSSFHAPSIPPWPRHSSFCCYLYCSCSSKIAECSNIMCIKSIRTDFLVVGECWREVTAVVAAAVAWRCLEMPRVVHSSAILPGHT